MAYVTYYTVNFTNEQGNEVLISIDKKDGAPTIPVNYECTQFELNDNGEEQIKYNCIITRELVLGIWSKLGDTLTWETFISSTHDEWKITVLIDGMKYFEGFITPDEGNAAFQDQPYEIIIRATNSLSLLKNIPLTDNNGNEFTTDHTLIEFIAGALKKTLLDLPIRVYCNYLYADMQDKADGLQFDMFNQAKLNYRTFQKDAVTFISCYDALKVILNRFCTLEYWNGRWQIVNIAEKQYLSGDWFYVDYDANGANPTGVQVVENHAQIGKAVDIYPINEDQQVSSRFAVKSVKSNYNYEVWPELPKNNKFERGTVTETGTNPDGTTYKIYTIPDWTYGGVTSYASLPALAPTSDSAHRRSTYNTFNIELFREIILQSGGSPQKFLQSEGVPVNAGDKINVNVDFKKEISGSGAQIIMFIYVIASDGTKWWLTNNLTSQMFPFFWEIGVGHPIQKFYDTGEDFAEYTSLNIESPAIPIDGKLYSSFQNNNADNDFYYRNFQIEYIPFIAGGYIQVKGDYWFTQQNKVFLDVTDEEIKTSDSPKRVLMGALIFNDALTDERWYRFNTIASPNPTNEQRHFKELLNLGRYNNAYRRMYSLEGSFNGLTYAPENNQLNIQPIGFHKRYRVVDLSVPRDFVLVPPLKMDVIRGWITANLVEVRKDDNDGTQPGDTHEFKYIF